MKIRIIYLSSMFCLLFAGMSYGQEELNLYLKIAAESNPGLKASYNEYLAALEKVPQVGALPDPSISFAYFIQPVETRVGPQQAKISLRQMFPWFGTLNAKEDVATELAKMKYEAFEDAKSRLFFEVKSAYYNIYFIQKGIHITEDNMGILLTFKELATIKFEAGLSSAVDALRVEMELSDLENQLAYLKDNKRVLEVKFNNFLNVANNSPILIPDTLWNDDMELQADEVLDSIFVQNHLIKQLEHKILTWKSQEQVAKKLGMPNFSLGVDYVSVGKSDNPMLSSSENGRNALVLPMLSLSVPIYRKKYTAMAKEASLRMEAANFQKEDKQNELTTLFEATYKDYKDANRRIILYQKQLILAEQSLDILLATYSVGGKNFEEVLRMERKVLKYSLELEKARSDKNAATAFINYLTGK